MDLTLRGGEFVAWCKWFSATYKKSSYWVASRCISSNDNYSYFEVSAISSYGKLVGEPMCTSDTQSYYSIDNAIFPVVTLDIGLLKEIGNNVYKVE